MMSLILIFSAFINSALTEGSNTQVFYSCVSNCPPPYHPTIIQQTTDYLSDPFHMQGIAIMGIAVLLIIMAIMMGINSYWQYKHPELGLKDLSFFHRYDEK